MPNRRSLYTLKDVCEEDKICLLATNLELTKIENPNNSMIQLLLLFLLHKTFKLIQS
jgi:hypothetical protein